MESWDLLTKQFFEGTSVVTIIQHKLLYNIYDKKNKRFLN